MSTSLYDPLTYENLMAGLTLRFETLGKTPLPFLREAQIEGPGIYALFYVGDLEAYVPISDGESPIYVGKAEPPGKRKGRDLDEDSPALRNRLRSHLRSIEGAENLDPADFLFRSLAVVPVWISLAERFLIDSYRPVWNVCLEGFGKHDSGKSRAAGERSWWDTLHPGREWAKRESAGRKSVEDARQMVRSFFADT